MKPRTLPAVLVLTALLLAPTAQATRTVPQLGALTASELAPPQLSPPALDAGQTPASALSLLPANERAVSAALAPLDEPDRARLLALRRLRLTGAAAPLSRFELPEWGQKTASRRKNWPGAPNLWETRLVTPGLRQGDLFLELDPLGPVDSPNLYQAFGFDGLNVRDPFGLGNDWEYAPGGPKNPAVRAAKERKALQEERERAQAKWEQENAEALAFALNSGARTYQQIRDKAADYFHAHGYARGIEAQKRMGQFLPRPETISEVDQNYVDRFAEAGKFGDALEKGAVLEGWLAVQGLVAIAGAEAEVVQASGTLAARTAGRSLTGIPHGFRNVAQFEDFAAKLNSGLRRAGYDDVEALFQGSSVTGKKFTTGIPFDLGRVSDFDIALVSPDLMDRARAIGVALRSAGTRTAPLTAEQLEALGLRGIADELALQAGRPVNFMVFESVEGATSKAPSILVPGGD